MRYLIGCDATWINKIAQAFPTPALRKKRKDRAPHRVADACEFKGWATRPAVWISA